MKKDFLTGFSFMFFVPRVEKRGCLKSQIPYQVRNDAIRLLLRQPPEI